MSFQDVRYALRSLARAPGFTLVALITLALGIGATTAIFSVVDGILLRPLPYPTPDRIVRILRSSPATSTGDAFAPADYLDYRRQNRSLAAVAGYRQEIIDLTGGVEPIRLTALETTGGFRVVVRAAPYHDTLVGDVRNALLVLFGAVVFVLLIACANVASLLLARGAWRRREFALRTALGAGRSRLVRQVLTESLVLSAGGGAFGLLGAFGTIKALVALAPESIPRLSDVGLDLRVLLFAFAASAIVGVMFGVIPAVQGARTEVSEALKDGGRTATSRTGIQKAFVIAEVALALVLLRPCMRCCRCAAGHCGSGELSPRVAPCASTP